MLLALRLERGDGVQAREELRKIRALLDSEPNLARVTLHESLTDLVDRWRGFAEISFEVTSKIESPEIIKVVNEAVNNSVRHGMAHHIEVFISDTNSGVTVKVLDDGIGPRTGPKGLGTKFFDSVGTWSLSQMPSGGSELQVLLR